MWPLTFLFLSISTLRSLSWAAFALSCLLLLAGLYVWNSAISVISTLASKISSSVESGNVKIYKDDKLLPSVPPEFLAQTVTQLVDASRTNIRRVAALSVIAFLIAGASMATEEQAHTRIVNSIRELRNVEVLSVDAPQVFTALVPAKDNWPQKQDERQTFRLCGDPLPLKPGLVMTSFQYKQMPDCLLIDAQTPVNYLRDAHDPTTVVDRSGNNLFAKENQ